MNLRTHTTGGVLLAGGDVLDLIPTGDKLVLEEKVRPIDIDVVQPDLPATIHFVAYKQWTTTPVVEGKVTRVSADAVTFRRPEPSSTTNKNPTSARLICFVAP